MKQDWLKFSLDELFQPAFSFSCDLGVYLLQ